MGNEEPYNGWTNYETWLLVVNLDNEENLHNNVKEWFMSLDKPFDIYKVANIFREWLEENFWVEDHNIFKICDTWTYRDWQEINWFEVSRSYLSEFDIKC